MKLVTHLISGAGNTFHITYLPQQEVEKLSQSQLKEIAISICGRQKADGFIFLSASSSENNPCQFNWKFFNNDGSNAEMCGNATRCVGFFLENEVKSPHHHWSLETIAGKVRIFCESKNSYRVIMSPIRKLQSDLGFYYDTGVPHLVIESQDQNLFEGLEKLKESASRLRQHKSFSPKGTNVTFCFLEADNRKIKAVSFERGVEDFTAACGTGAVAAAYFNLTKRSIQETEVEMPGGTLIINLKDLNQPEMTGPAVLLGSFTNEVAI